MAGFVDLGMQMGVAGDGMGVCETSGLVVCSEFEENTTGLEQEQLVSVFWGNTAHFDTGVTRMAVSAHCSSGGRLFLQICSCKQCSPRVRPKSVCW